MDGLLLNDGDFGLLESTWQFFYKFVLNEIDGGFYRTLESSNNGKKIATDVTAEFIYGILRNFN